MLRSCLFALLFTFFALTGFSQDSLKTPLKGIGIQYRTDTANQSFVITRVFAGNAGADAGLREGDILVAINQQPLWPMSAEARSLAMRGGEKGGPYTLTVKRELLTSLGTKEQLKEVQVAPRLIVTETCVTGDCKNGQGKLLDNASGEAKEGRFVNGDLVAGKIYYRSGRIRAEGTFKNRLLEGSDCVTYYDSEYQSGRIPVHRKGQFTAGILRTGRIFSADGTSQLIGTFDEKGVPHGKGFVIRRPGFSYEGDVVHGELTGQAKSMTYQEGNYEGPVVKGKPEGKGIWYWSGRKHKGKFVNGLMEGQFQVTEKAGTAKYHRVYQYRNGVQL